MIAVNWSRFSQCGGPDFKSTTQNVLSELKFGKLFLLFLIVFVVMCSHSRTLPRFSPWINNLELKELRAENCFVFSERDTLQINFFDQKSLSIFSCL